MKIKTSVNDKKIVLSGCKTVSLKLKRDGGNITHTHTHTQYKNLIWYYRNLLLKIWSNIRF